MNRKPIPLYVINLKDRCDRKKHIEEEFTIRDEFEVHIIETDRHKKGTIGLWLNIRRIIKQAVQDEEKSDYDFIIFCEDDHQFTSEYSEEKLFKYIEEARKRNADLLLGGVSGFTSALEVFPHLFWVEEFSGLQFTIIFSGFFQKILEVHFCEWDAADYKISSLTDNKFFIYPFMSIQKDFGYSDVTPGNNALGIVEKGFKECNAKIGLLKQVFQFYKIDWRRHNPLTKSKELDNLIIPVYAIILTNKIDNTQQIVSQFTGRKEFDVKIIERYKHQVDSIALWLTIRSIIITALEKDEDVIVICEDSHEFTYNYSSQFLFQNIIGAHGQYVDFLCGGVSDFETAIPVSHSRFWINPCSPAPFIVIYKKFFQKIMNEPFDNTVAPYLLLSEMTANKMVLYPFISSISRQNCSSAKGTSSLKRPVEDQSNLFEVSSQRLQTIGEVYYKYLG